MLFAPSLWMRQAEELCRLSRLAFGRSPQSLVHPALPAGPLRFEPFKHIPVDTKRHGHLCGRFLRSALTAALLCKGVIQSPR